MDNSNLPKAGMGNQDMPMKTRSWVLVLFAIASAVGYSRSSMGEPPQIPVTLIGISRAEALLDAYGGRPELLSEAEQLIDKALEANPDDVLALVLKSRVTLDRGAVLAEVYRPEELAAAIQTLEHAVELDPKRVDARILLAKAYVSALTRQEEAFQQLQIAGKLAPRDPDVDLAYIQAYRYSNDWKNVKKRLKSAMRKASRLEPIPGRYALKINYERRRLHSAEGRSDLVTQDFESSLKLSPESAWIRGDFANHLLVNIGDTDRAIHEARSAMEIMPYPLVRRTLGVALYAKWATVRSEDPLAAQRFRDEARLLVRDTNLVLGIALANAKVNRDLSNLSVALMAEGYSIDARDSKGESALLRAIRMQDLEEVRMLLDAGADPNQRNFMDKPIVILAVEYDNGLLDMVIEHGANLEVANEYGQRPLHVAALKNSPRSVRALLSQHVDVNARGHMLETPLMIAARQKKSLAVAKLLVEAGADIALKDADDADAVRLAELAGNKEVAEWLGRRSTK